MHALNATARKQAEGQRMGPLPLLASLSPPTQGWSLPRFVYTSAGLSLAPCVSPGPAALVSEARGWGLPACSSQAPQCPPWGVLPRLCPI